jgi:hypothetical protein
LEYALIGDPKYMGLNAPLSRQKNGNLYTIKRFISPQESWASTTDKTITAIIFFTLRVEFLSLGTNRPHFLPESLIL